MRLTAELTAFETCPALEYCCDPVCSTQQLARRGPATCWAVSGVGRYVEEAVTAQGAGLVALQPDWPHGTPLPRPQRAGKRFRRGKELPDTPQVPS